MWCGVDSGTKLLKEVVFSFITFFPPLRHSARLPDGQGRISCERTGHENCPESPGSKTRSQGELAYYVHFFLPLQKETNQRKRTFSAQNAFLRKVHKHFPSNHSRFTKVATRIRHFLTLVTHYAAWPHFCLKSRTFCHFERVPIVRDDEKSQDNR